MFSGKSRTFKEYDDHRDDIQKAKGAGGEGGDYEGPDAGLETTGFKRRFCGCFKGMTAAKINKMQKITFPVSFVLFTVLYSLSAYYRIGDVSPEEESNLSDE